MPEAPPASFISPAPASASPSDPLAEWRARWAAVRDETNGMAGQPIIPRTAFVRDFVEGVLSVCVIPKNGDLEAVKARTGDLETRLSALAGEPVRIRWASFAELAREQAGAK